MPLIGTIANASARGFGGLRTFVQLPTGGDEVKTVGSYRYHFFTSNGSLVVPASRNIEIISCGGGGGGGQRIAGGGGGAELDILVAVNNAVGTYTVTVGNAGAGSTTDNVRGSQGGTSSFALGGTTYVTSLGGGGGGSGSSGEIAGGTGGSGGGGTFYGGNGGTASGSNTNAGGNGVADKAGGGGGGATAVGNAGTTVNTNPNSQGGQGYTLTSIDSNLTAANFTSLTGMTVICSGGGGARFGAVGGTSVAVGGTGGGDGGFGTTPTPPTAGVSFGSGGGAGAWETPRSGANGKQGVVIVRYAV
jgi:hypothetical protein